MKWYGAILAIFWCVAFSSHLSAANVLDISKQYRTNSAELLMQAPQFYQDKSIPHLYHVLPKAFRVVQPNGKPLKSIVRLPNGRLIISARLGPWPRDFKSDPHMQQLVSRILADDPAATFIAPTLKSPSVKVLGSLAHLVESVTITGTTTATSETFVTIKVNPEHSARFIEDLKRSVGILGVIEFTVVAFNGLQDIDWPVAFSWHVGDLTVP